MSAETLQVVLLAAALLVALAGWWSRGNRGLAVLLLVLTAAAATVAVGAPDWVDDRSGRAALVVLTGLLATLGGGPLASAVFRVVDGPGAPGEGSVRRAAEVLRGGAWIGALERIAVFASIASGWPEGLALTLALKGLGRYPELRHEERPGIAERFLIGTFVSVLWASACAGTASLMLG